MNKQELQTRIKNLAIQTARLCILLPVNFINKIYTGQLVRSSSSAAANYRAACRGKSKADFVHKLRIVEEELDETMFFYEMLAEFNPNSKSELRTLYKEAEELLSIMIASINTTNKNIEMAKSVKKNPKSPI